MDTLPRSNRRVRLVWKDSFSVGIEELDAQHRRLLDLINETGELADRRVPLKSEAFGALNAMIRYAEHHFQTEEGYLEKYGYTGYLQQKEEHEAFVDSVFSMTHELEKESSLSLGAIIFYLEDWYSDHVLGLDQGYKQFLASKMKHEAKAAPADGSEKIPD